MDTLLHKDGTAFPYRGPTHVRMVDGAWVQGDANFPGMSLRDYFAAKAMAVKLTSFEGEQQAHQCAKWCYEMADAMLEMRKR